jgi:malate dehydrogenase (oxaloacetate-decarboxylating)
MTDLRDFQVPYARPPSEADGWSNSERPIGLRTVVANTRPTILVGTSTQGGAFSEPIVREMARHVERPMIFPLSNPTELIEAVPADLIEWTDGRALVGTGMPWEPVAHRGIDYEIAQTNNALIYPGIGLGTIVSRAGRVTDGMLLAGSEALAALVDVGRPGAGVLPAIENLRATSAAVAVAVARQAVSDGVARADPQDPDQAVGAAMWRAAYPSLEVG